MKNVLYSLTILLALMGCKNESKQNTKAMENDSTGIYEAVFIDIQSTEIPQDIEENVKMERVLLKDINLNDPEMFWGEKKDFLMFAMGSIKMPQSGEHKFRLTSAGKVKFQLDNKVLVENKEIHDKQSEVKSAYLNKGYAIFEIEYYPSYKDPYLVLEWSPDGENFEIIPTVAFNNLDSFTIPNWQGNGLTEEESKEDNILTQEEIDAGWELLFDGKTTNGWHTYNKPGRIGRKWKAQDGMLVFEGRKQFEFYVGGRKIELGSTNKVADGGEDIVSDKAYENFELSLEWKISEAGNGGIFYTVQEDSIYDEVWKTSPEMQVLDNQKHKDGLIYRHRSGDLYDLIAADPIRVKDQGKWNQIKIVKNQGEIEHWMNGTRVVSYNINSPDWKDIIAKSKFSQLSNFANPGPGHIGFQDHSNLVFYKNIKIRPIE